MQPPAFKMLAAAVVVRRGGAAAVRRWCVGDGDAARRIVGQLCSEFIFEDDLIYITINEYLQTFRLFSV